MTTCLHMPARELGWVLRTAEESTGSGCLHRPGARQAGNRLGGSSGSSGGDGEAGDGGYREGIADPSQKV